jgi:hypothetical protein
MAPLSNANRAILDLRKIDDYCLNASHPRGRHKARVFRDALGSSKAMRIGCVRRFLPDCKTTRRWSSERTFSELAGA